MLEVADLNNIKNPEVNNLFALLQKLKGNGTNILPYIRFHFGGEVLHDSVVAVIVRPDAKVLVISKKLKQKNITICVETFVIPKLANLKTTSDVVLEMKNNPCDILSMEFLLTNKILKNTCIVHHLLSKSKQVTCEEKIKLPHVIGFIDEYSKAAEVGFDLLPLFLLHYSGLVNPNVHGIFLDKKLGIKVVLVEEVGQDWDVKELCLDGRKLFEKFYGVGGDLLLSSEIFLNNLEVNFKKIFTLEGLVDARIICSNSTSLNNLLGSKASCKHGKDCSDINAAVNQTALFRAMTLQVSKDLLNLLSNNIQKRLLSKSIVCEVNNVQNFWDYIGFHSSKARSKNTYQGEQQLNKEVKAAVELLSPSTMVSLTAFFNISNDSCGEVDAFADLSMDDIQLTLNGIKEYIEAMAQAEWAEKNNILYS